jgi:hypothetical protein
VQFETDEAFENCVNDTEPQIIDGRQVRVRQAQGRLEPDTAYVRGIPAGTTREDLLGVFPDAVAAKIAREDSDEAVGFAFVKFATGAGLSEALARRTVTIQGQQSIVKKSRVRFDPRGRAWIRRRRRS